MDPKVKKTALRMIVSGLYLLTVEYENRFNASTISWVSQASFDPPLVMLGVKADTLTHTMVESRGQFAINILAIGQNDLAQAFFKQAEYKDGKLNGYAFDTASQTGAPIFQAAPAWFECEVMEMVKGGDHSVVVARVIEAGVRNPDAEPMALRDTPWQYGG
jgi:flavin reductase (DIM6/NTAB) family NADH-FMN oxidoreductase RutF